MRESESLLFGKRSGKTEFPDFHRAGARPRKFKERYLQIRVSCAEAAEVVSGGPPTRRIRFLRDSKDWFVMREDARHAALSCVRICISNPLTSISLSLCGLLCLHTSRPGPKKIQICSSLTTHPGAESYGLLGWSCLCAPALASWVQAWPGHLQNKGQQAKLAQQTMP